MQWPRFLQRHLGIQKNNEVCGDRVAVVLLRGCCCFGGRVGAMMDRLRCGRCLTRCPTTSNGSGRGRWREGAWVGHRVMERSSSRRMRLVVRHPSRLLAALSRLHHFIRHQLASARARNQRRLTASWCTAVWTFDLWLIPTPTMWERSDGFTGSLDGKQFLVEWSNME